MNPQEMAKRIPLPKLRSILCAICWQRVIMASNNLNDLFTEGLCDDCKLEVKKEFEKYNKGEKP